ncbi:UNVERIFIED_CONTAM: hypothetical protein NCL1_31828 [Trichonephila clavipes]
MENKKKDKTSDAGRLLLQSKLDSVSEMFSRMESLKIEYYEVVEEKQLPNLELTFEEMEENLEEIKVGLQALLLKHDNISKNVSICNIALSNNDNPKSSFIKLPDVTLPEFHGGPPLKLKTPFPNKGKSFMVRKQSLQCRKILFECVSYSAASPSVAPLSPRPEAVINNPSETQTIQTFSSLNKSKGIWSPVLNSYVWGRVILDSTSQLHFMTLQFASKLGLEKKKINLTVSGLKSENTDNCIKKLWEVEEILLDKPLSKEEEFCEMHFRNTHTRDCTGRFII